MKLNNSDYGEGKLYLVGKVYHFRFWHEGREIKRSAKTGNDKVARRRFEEAKRATREGGAQALEKRATVMFEDLEKLVYADQARNDHLSTRPVVSGFNALRRTFAGVRANEIFFAALVDYWDARKAEGAKPATIRTELGYLKRGFNLAAKAGLVRGVPAFPRIKVRNARKVFIDADVYAAILAHIAPHVRRAIIVDNLLGWRRGELLGLTWARNVDMKRRELVLYADQQKGFRLTGEETATDDRHIPFDEWPAIEAALVEQRAFTDAEEKRLGRIIPSVFHYAGKPIASFKSAWTSACVKAGFAVVVGTRNRLRADGTREPQYRATYRIHDFRRTALRRLETDLHVAGPAAKRIIGHRTDAMKDRYGIATNADVAAAGIAVTEFMAREAAGVPASPKVVSMVESRKRRGQP